MARVHAIFACPCSQRLRARELKLTIPGPAAAHPPRLQLLLRGHQPDGPRRDDRKDARIPVYEKEELLGDLRLIRDNCRAFNGDHIYTNYAQRLVDLAGNDLKVRAKQVSYLTQFARNEAERAKRFGGY